MSVNKVILVGRLGADPDTATTKKDISFTLFNIATTEKWTDQKGEKNERVEWHKCVCYGALAKTCSQYLKKGSQVYVEGKLKTGSWDDNGTKRFKTEILVDNVQFLSSSKESLKEDGPTMKNLKKVSHDSESPL